MFEIKEPSDFKLIRDLMPAWEEIPAKFKDYRGTPWNEIFSDWFFCGAKNIKLTPKSGVDSAKAMRHIDAVMTSFQPSHEHKEAAVSFLLSEWFESITYDKENRK